MTFQELGLSEETVIALDKLELTSPTPIQAAAIPVVLGGKDMIGKSVTGSGKTFAYGLPLITKLDKDDDRVQSVVVCPTRELAEQVAVQLRKVTNACDRVKVTLLTGGMDMGKQIKSLKESIKIVVGTPGRLCDHLRRRTLKVDGVKAVVLDEADEMLTMGFREELSAILKAMPKYRQTLMFSATMPDGVREIANNYMNDPQAVEIGEKVSTVELIRQGFIFCKNADKNNVLIDALKAVDTDKCVVFCNTRRTVEMLADALSAAHFNVKALHGQMQQSERRRAMNAARSYDGAVLVATDVAARGIDISDIEYVFNYDLPHELEFYIHRIGRTARAGKRGTAVTIVSTRLQQQNLMEYAATAKSEVVPMAVSDGKLVELGAVKNSFEEKIGAARKSGDLSEAERLETAKKADDSRRAGTDRTNENLLEMLRRSPDRTEQIEQLRTFGYSDEELLAAALALIAKADDSRRRSREDKERGMRGKNYAKKPTGERKSESKAPSKADGKPFGKPWGKPDGRGQKRR